jgi:signal peptide peptidase SppA
VTGRYHRILEAIFASPWAILPEKLELIISVVGARSKGFPSDPRFEARSRPASRRTTSNIAVLPLYGTIVQRADLMSDFSGGTSTIAFAQMFHAAIADPSVDAVIIEIDSPGGSVYGVDELAAEIHNSRGTKKICAIANSLMASAAYWIGSAAAEISATPGGEVGSIGVYGAHTDESKALEAEGLAITLISAGKFKTEGNSYEPLGAEAKAALQRRVDQYYSMFVKAVAKQRGASQAAVRDGYGQGRVLGAADALKAGLIDRVETLDQMLARLGAKVPASKTRAQMAERAPGIGIDARKRRLRLLCPGSGF